MSEIIKKISQLTGISVKQVNNTVKLIDDGATVPFIARYRKEVTGNLDEEQIREVLENVTYVRNLEKRKEEVLKLIDEQGKLTEELKKEIIAAEKLQKVEDLYLPYKRKKKTKADVAKENGLEPLSVFMMLDNTFESLVKESEKYLNENVENVKEAIEGAKLIIAQGISETASYREYIRHYMLKDSIVKSSLVKKNVAKDEKQVYQDYYEYEEPVKNIASHRVLAFNRGEKEKILKVSINLTLTTRELVKNKILKDFINHNLKDIFIDVINDSLDRLILPSIEREVRNILTESASEEAIDIFKKNLKNLLLQPPLYEKNILGLDPAFRTGCKVVVINKHGEYETGDVVFVTMSEGKSKEAELKIKKYIEKYDIDIIAIGNGTASRETEKFVADFLGNNKFGKKIYYLIVNEAGASVYSASKLAKEEFPDLDVTARGAISIARRIQDPLGELVKIDPKSIGVGMYQHDVNQNRLTDSLDNVIESVVNNVGVNVNTSSWALLSHVSGLKKNIAKNIVDYRNENGKFTSRAQLKKVKGLGEKAYTLCAGFVVVPESKNVLDNTVIHPESYSIAKEIIEEAGCVQKDLRDNIEELREKLKIVDLSKLITEKNYGEATTKDIYDALLKDRRDPRDSLPKPLLKEDILKIEDLKDGMELEGTVRNVVKFGTFIDIGLKNDALLHISEFGGKFITDPTQVMGVGDIIKVKVKSIDIKRGRVSLTKKGM